MVSFSGIWDTVRDQFSLPKLSDQELEKILKDVRSKLPVPVFWLLGKTQSGKTSLIRGLTGSTETEIGNGFRPCTKTARLYTFPGEEDPLIRFLDTRGLGEVNYHPQEDLDVFQSQAHLILVVMKATDHAQQQVIDALREIRKVRSDWPIIVAQTCLHEAYPRPSDPHLNPYPFDKSPWPPEVPTNLTRTLLKQRELFADLPVRFVPVDFTLPEDGYEPQFYGLESLWAAIEQALPIGLRNMLGKTDNVRQSLRDAHFRAAHPHIISHALAAGAVGLVPIPFVDMPVVIGIQTKMCYALASIYNQPMSAQRLADIGSGLGLSFLGRLGVRGLAKLIPGVGSAVNSLYAAASTYALGRTLSIYFSYALDGDLPDQATFQKIYEEQFKEGREHLQKYLQSMWNKNAAEGDKANPS